MAGGYPSKAVANWLIERYGADHRSLTQLQLQKVEFIAHGWHLAMSKTDDGLVAETVHAWKFGPVFPSLRREFREFGDNPIPRFADEWLEDDVFVTPQLETYHPKEWEIEVLERVYKQYGKFKGPQLIEFTHRPGTPWYEVTNGGRNISLDMIIPNELIRKYYIRRLGLGS